MKNYVNYAFLGMLFMLIGCGGIENEKLDTQHEVKRNKLLVPPKLDYFRAEKEDKKEDEFGSDTSMAYIEDETPDIKKILEGSKSTTVTFSVSKPKGRSEIQHNDWTQQEKRRKLDRNKEGWRESERRKASLDNPPYPEKLRPEEEKTDIAKISF